MDFMGIGGWEIVVLLAIAAAVIAALFVVVRMAVISGIRRARQDTEPLREDRRG